MLELKCDLAGRNPKLVKIIIIMLGKGSKTPREGVPQIAANEQECNLVTLMEKGTTEQ